MSYSHEEAIKAAYKYLPVFKVNTLEHILLQATKNLACDNAEYLCLRLSELSSRIGFYHAPLKIKIQESIDQSITLEDFLSKAVKKKAENLTQWQRIISKEMSVDQAISLRNNWIDKILDHNKDAFRKNCELTEEDIYYLLKAYKHLPVFSITTEEAEVLQAVKYSDGSYLCYRLDDYCRGFKRIRARKTCGVLQHKIHDALGQSVFITGFLLRNLPAESLSDNCRRVLRDLWIDKLIQHNC